MNGLCGGSLEPRSTKYFFKSRRNSDGHRVPCATDSNFSALISLVHLSAKRRLDVEVDRFSLMESPGRRISLMKHGY